MLIDRTSPDHVIKSLLAGLRHRARVRLSLIAASGIIGLCLIALVVARWLGLSAQGLTDLTAAVVGIGTIAFLVSVPVIVRVTRPIASFARRADTVLGLDERLSTSHEIIEIPAEQRSLVARALLAETGEHARMISPGAAEPLLSRVTIAALGGVVAAGLAYGLFADPSDAGSYGKTPRSAATEARAGNELVADIRQMADLVTADAALWDDSYLAAVGESLRELADLGEAMAPADVLERFAELADHAARGYGDDLPAWMPQTEEQLADIGQRMADFIDQTNQRPQQVAEALSQLSPTMCASEGATHCDDGTDWDLLSELAPDRRGAASTQLGERGQDGMATGPLMDGGGEDDGDIGLELLDFETGAARPVGANTQSGRGSGDAVGDGTLDYQRSTEFLDAQIEAREQFSVAAGEDEAGNRIEILFVPEVSYTDVADSAANLAPQFYPWNDAVATRDYVPMRDRAVVGRFFSRQAQQ